MIDSPSEKFWGQTPNYNTSVIRCLSPEFDYLGPCLSLFADVVLGRGLEFVFAVFTTEEIGLPFIRRLVLGSAFIDFHATHWVDSHKSTPWNVGFGSNKKCNRGAVGVV